MRSLTVIVQMYVVCHLLDAIVTVIQPIQTANIDISWTERSIRQCQPFMETVHWSFAL